MLVFVPSVTHIRERVIPGGGIHCHWKEPSLATVQERLAADTTSSGPGGTGGSMEGGCRNVIEVVGSALVGGMATNERGKSPSSFSYNCTTGLITAAFKHAHVYNTAKIANS